MCSFELVFQPYILMNDDVELLPSVCSGGRFKNVYKLLNLRALKISMYGQDILCGISKVPFEIPHKISYPYIERCVFYSQVKI